MTKQNPESNVFIVPYVICAVNTKYKCLRIDSHLTQLNIAVNEVFDQILR
jgi:hypothetical protein